MAGTPDVYLCSLLPREELLEDCFPLPLPVYAISSYPLPPGLLFLIPSASCAALHLLLPSCVESRLQRFVYVEFRLQCLVYAEFPLETPLRIGCAVPVSVNILQLVIN